MLAGLVGAITMREGCAGALQRPAWANEAGRGDAVVFGKVFGNSGCFSHGTVTGAGAVVVAVAVVVAMAVAFDVDVDVDVDVAVAVAVAVAVQLSVERAVTAMPEADKVRRLFERSAA
jgi:hypothetical protein